MTPKKRLTRKDPGYFIPLPFAMAIKKVIPEVVFDQFVFRGMQLELRMMGAVNLTIAVIAHFKQEDHIIGYIPNGMISRVEGILLHDEKILVSLERKACDRLKNAFWICIDELPDLPTF